MKPHKHAALIKAWADGAEIELYDGGVGQWLLSPTPRWYNECQYRIKSEPKPDVVKFANVYLNCDGSAVFDVCGATHGCGGDAIKFTFDGETLKLKAVEMIGEK